MKCNKCGEFRETLDDIRGCEGCNDGTSQQIKPEESGETPISESFGNHPGFENRFLPGSNPSIEQAAVKVIATTHALIAGGNIQARREDATQKPIRKSKSKRP